MSSGISHKFQNSVIRVLTAFDESSPGPMTVSAITKADPAVATVNSTTVLGSTGDYGVVKLSSVEGMTELEDAVIVVKVVNATTLTLLGVNSSGYGTFSGTALAAPGDMSRWCEVTSFNRAGGSAAEIDNTDVCSVAVETIRGLKDNGSITADFKFAPETAIQLAIKDFDDSGDLTAINYSPPGGAWSRWAIGYISTTSETGQTNQRWNGSLSFRVTGPIIQETA